MHIHTAYNTPLPPYSVMIALSLMLGIGVMYVLDRRGRVPAAVCRQLLLVSPVMCVICALGLTYITTGGSGVGLSSLGGLIGMYASVLMLAVINGDRTDAFTMFENCTLALPLMYAVGKAGCTLAGCCRGFDYSGTMSIHYTGRTGDFVEFPVQPLESLVFIIIFAAGLLVHLRGRRAAVGVYISAAAAKFILDFFRQSHSGAVISLTQVLCLALAALGAASIAVFRFSTKNG